MTRSTHPLAWTTQQTQPVAPPGFCNRGGVMHGSIGGLEYEVPQSRLYCLCIDVALCSTALQCICRAIRRSSMTMKAHTYYTIFGRPPIGGGKLPPPLAAPLNATLIAYLSTYSRRAITCNNMYRSATSLDGYIRQYTPPAGCADSQLRGPIYKISYDNLTLILR